MIDQQLIDSAKLIRRSFLRLSDQLLTYKEDVKVMANFLIQKSKELKEYNDTVIRKKKESIANVTDHLIKELTSIEDEEKKIQKKVEKINIEMEKLRKEEEILYMTIRERYPKMTEEAIVKEIHSHLEK